MFARIVMRIALLTAAVVVLASAQEVVPANDGVEATQAPSSEQLPRVAAAPQPAPPADVAHASPPAPAVPLLRKGLAKNESEMQATETKNLTRTSNSTNDTRSKDTNSKTNDTMAIEGASVPVSTFFWNVHWQCSVAARGATRSCKERMGRRFAELALGAGAQIVTSIELSNGMSEPVSLSSLGLAGWTQVNGPCARGYNGDSAALAFAPGWQVEQGDGGCLRYDWDTRAFAVAKVKPPVPVQGCPSLCVVGLHAPHQDITAGNDVVQRVCGEAAAGCTVAMGDWNVPAESVGQLWSRLVGGTPPTLARPNLRTCCFPERDHYGVYDHVATNIGGASTADEVIYDYQLLEENPVEEHRPVHVRLMLPSAR